MLDYQSIAKKLQELDVFALMPTGRTGSDYLQALLEDHPEIMTFNGHFLIYEEFVDIAMSMVGNTFENPSDVVDEFVGKFLYKLVSKFDLQEGKDQLGESRNENFRIDTNKFRHHFTELIKWLATDSRSVLLSIYGAYHLCLNRNFEGVKILLHHPHLEYDLQRFLEDFPNSKILFTVRDPRASIYSQVTNFRTYYPDTHDCQSHFYMSLRMNLIGARLAPQFRNERRTIRLEDLPRQDTLEALSRWLDISYSKSMQTPTWGGLMWNGDRLSKKNPPNEWTPQRTNNNWSQRLSRRDQWLLKCLFGRTLVINSYISTSPKKFQRYLAVFLCLIPMSLELRYFSPKYVAKKIVSSQRGFIQVCESPFFYFRRVQLCIKILRQENKKNAVETLGV